MQVGTIRCSAKGGRGGKNAGDIKKEGTRFKRKGDQWKKGRRSWPPVSLYLFVEEGR